MSIVPMVLVLIAAITLLGLIIYSNKDTDHSVA